jgi:hypothetical protein
MWIIYSNPDPHGGMYLLYNCHSVFRIKVPLKAKIVQILFSQMHQKFETFTVAGITIAYQTESMA